MKKPTLYDAVIHRAMADAFYEKIIDECWEELLEVLERPTVKEARRRFLQAMAEEFARKRENAEPTP